MDNIKSFAFDLDLTFCTDGECTDMDVLDGATVPIPFCNPNITFTLPGDGSIIGFAKFVGKGVGDEAIQAVLRKLGLEVIENVIHRNHIINIFLKDRLKATSAKTAPYVSS